MKQTLLTLVGALLLLGPAFGREVDIKQGATLNLKTLTEFGVDLDDPAKYGLNFSLPELELTFDLFGHQAISNRLKSADPVGFIDLTLDTVQIRFANLALPDYNNNESHVMTPGFNDSKAADTGYFSPFYIQNLRSGILWGDWILQLGVGGADSFWDPWHREQMGYAQIASSWAYLDTRVQYQRDLIPVLIKDRMAMDKEDANKTFTFSDESNYWAYDDRTKSAATGVDELAPSFDGTMIGLQYAGAEFQSMVKVATKQSWMKLEHGATNGLAAGLDFAVTPTSAKGFRVLGSAVTGLFQGGAVPNAVAGGAKVGYDLPLPRSGLKITSIEPFVGFDALQPFAIRGTGAGALAVEASTGLTLHWPGMNGWGDDYLQGNYGRTGNVYSGMTIAYKVYRADVSVDTVKHSAQLTWYNDADGGLVNNVGSEMVAQWMDFANADGINALLLTTYVDYSIGGVFGGVLLPWTKVYFDNFKVPGMTGRSSNLKVDGGLKLKKVIRNAEFGLTYQSRNLFASPNSTNTKDGYGALGVVSLSALISL